MRVLVVGGTGFLGLAVTARLVLLGHTVCSISRSLPNLKKQVSGVTYQAVDISAEGVSLNRIVKTPFDLVINAGGYVTHPTTTSEKANFFDEMSVYAKNLYRLIRLSKPSKVINFGSSLEYGDSISPQSEDARDRPHCIYGITRALISRYLDACRLIDDLNVYNLRIYQVYGPGQGQNRIIPGYVVSKLTGQYFEVRDPWAVRDFLFIDDFLDLVSLFLCNDPPSGVYNAGSGYGISIMEILNLIDKNLAAKSQQSVRLLTSSSGISQSNAIYACTRKVQSVLGWSPKVLVCAGIERVCNYYVRQQPLYM